MLTFGFLIKPTPAGVPVMITVPAGRVVPRERKLISSGMLNIRSLDKGLAGSRRGRELRDSLSTTFLHSLAV